jgi:hypothetical protein
MKTVDRLLVVLQTNSTQLSPWIHVTSSSVPHIIDSLKFWKTNAPSKTVRGFLQTVKPSSKSSREAFVNSFNALKGYRDEQEAQRTKEIREEVDNLPDEKVIEHATMMLDLPEYPRRKSSEVRAKWLRSARDGLCARFMEAFTGDDYVQGGFKADPS